MHLESNEQPSAFEKGEVDGAVTFDPYRAQFLRAGATTLFDSTQIPGEIVDLLAVRASVLDKQPKAIQALLTGWFGALDYMQARPEDAARRMGIRQQTTRRAVPGGAAAACTSRRARRTCRCSAARHRSSSVTGRRLMALMVDAKLLRARVEIESVLAPGSAGRACRDEPLRLPGDRSSSRCR